MHQADAWLRRGGGSRLLVGAAMAMVPALAAGAPLDRSRYISPDELRPGMKGVGRTVMSGTRIETFELEVISVMRNAYYAKQELVLIRCSGLNLEHSGIIGGMSGSPCYIRDESGKERLFGAVAFGWTFTKDPICGVQPITQMIDIPEVRSPDKRAQATADVPPAGANASRPPAGPAIPLDQWIARSWPEPIDEASRFSILNGQLAPARPVQAKAGPGLGGLRPLPVPVTVTGASGHTMPYLQRWFERVGLTPIAAGGAPEAARAKADGVKLEPGSALCVQLMTGDVEVEAMGTCTEVAGDRVLGFGHSLFGEGEIELPLATGFVHTVIPSVARSNKLGGSLRAVGTLWGDESTGIFGTIGKTPKMVPLDVVVTDARGKQSYHYDVVHEQNLTAILMTLGTMESLFAHSSPPREHTVRYAIEADFEKLGTFRTSNFTSQGGVRGISMDLMLPLMTLMDTPLKEHARASRARVEVTIEQGARAAMIEEATLARSVFEPGETVTVRVRWVHYRTEPRYTYASYSLTLPADIPDGEYNLTVGSVSSHLRALQSEKPHLFIAKTLSDALEALNLIGSFPGDRLYMHLGLKTGGLAVDRLEMPELPSFRRKILADAKSSDVRAYADALVVQHETEFAVQGNWSLPIRVSRRADQ